jgi:hypothetical protein
MAFTDEQKSKLARLAEAMMRGVEILSDAGVDLLNPAIVHLAEGSVAITGLLDEALAEIDKACACGQPLGHGVIQ